MSIRFGNGAVFSDVVDQIVCPTVIFAYDCLMLPSGLNIMLFASLGVGFAQVPIQFGVIWLFVSFGSSFLFAALFELVVPCGLVSL